VLDVGTGTEILSQAAEMLGAARVVSCDLFWYGLRSGSREFRHTFVGSADAVREGMAELTLANITPRVLDAIAYDLKRVTATGGKVLISGFLGDAEPKRFRPTRIWELNGWLCWLCERDGIDADNGRGEIIMHDQNWW
jgi:ribosomal protein L11 methylase PrmA